MGEIVNLRQVRKSRNKRAANAEAEANRALYGRTKPEKAADAAARARMTKLLEGARLDRDGEAGE